MRGREGLDALLDHGVIDTVIRPLMSGKEAQVWLVEVNGEHRVAKIYKRADHRSFKHRADYTEGRKVRSSRSMRAMQKGSRFGKEQIESAWRSAEVDAIHRLRAAGVRVPEPFDFVDDVLVMELVKDEHGEPAPRLADVTLTREEAYEVHQKLVREVCKMLCAGLVHGDLSDFNVLMSADGPVIIDFPQAIDAAANQNARKLLLRDVKNLTGFLARWAPKIRKTRYGPEMWALYERGELKPDTRLTGRYTPSDQSADVDAIVAEIRAAEEAERARRAALGLPEPRRARAPKPTDRKVQRLDAPERPERPAKPQSRSEESKNSDESDEGSRRKRRRKRRRKQTGQAATPRPPAPTAAPRQPPADPFDDLDALLSED